MLIKIMKEEAKIRRKLIAKLIAIWAKLGAILILRSVLPRDVPCIFLNHLMPFHIWATVTKPMTPLFVSTGTIIVIIFHWIVVAGEKVN